MSSYLINGRGNDELTQAITQVIDNAKTYIKACNFLFQDQDIISKLRLAAKRGVAIFIISNIRLNDYREDNEWSSDSTLPNLNDLKEMGCHVHLLKELHAKFIIADSDTDGDAQGIIMSANFSSNSIAKNSETGIYVYEDDLKELEYVFEKLYLSSDVTDIERNEKRNTLSRTYHTPQLELNQFQDSGMRFTIASTDDGNNLSGCNIHSIYSSILDIIKGSQQHLYLVTWHFNLLDRLPGFMDEVRNAINRGVKVYLYSNMYGKSNSQTSSREEIQKLIDLGCHAFSDDNNHSKCVLSEKSGIIFTANIDGYRGLLNGFEVGCMLTSQQRSASYNHVMNMISEAKNKRYPKKSPNKNITTKKRKENNYGSHRR